MNKQGLPQTDSIEELARFWDGHDLTDFEDELEVVSEPVFQREDTLTIALAPEELDVVRRLAQEKGVEQTELVRQWVLEKIHAV